MKQIKWQDLPKDALNQISRRQRSYIDEFSFFLVEGCNLISAMYAGEEIAVWNGEMWV